MKAAKLTDNTRARSTIETVQENNITKPLFPDTTTVNPEHENLPDTLQNKSSAVQQLTSKASAIKEQPATASVLQAVEDKKEKKYIKLDKGAKNGDSEPLTPG